MNKGLKESLIEIGFDTILGGLLGAGSCVALCVFSKEHKTDNLKDPITVGFLYGALTGALGSTAGVITRNAICVKK